MHRFLLLLEDHLIVICIYRRTWHTKLGTKEGAVRPDCLRRREREENRQECDCRHFGKIQK